MPGETPVNNNSVDWMADTKDGMKEEYGRYTYRKVLFIIACIILVFFLFFVSLCVGTLDLTISEVYTLFVQHITGYTSDDPQWAFNDHIVWDFRVPRAIFAIVAGVALSIGGAVMQSVMKNPLVYRAWR